MLAILLDGPEWAERRTTNDRDGLPTAVLQHIMGWPMVMRIWLPSWRFVLSGRCGRHRVRAGRGIASRLQRHVGERRVSTGYAAAAPPRNGQPLARVPVVRVVLELRAVPDLRTGSRRPGPDPTVFPPLPRRRSPTRTLLPRQEGGLSVLDGVKRRSPRHAAAVRADGVMRRIVAEKARCLRLDCSC